MADDGLRVPFGKLDSQLRSNQPKKALKTVDEILKAFPADQDALRCKALLLIELDKFDDALRVITGAGIEQAMAFEKAYCLYRLGRLEDALSTLQHVTAASQTVARLQLEAQLQYRLGAPKEAIRQYSQLFQQYGVEGMELRTNVLAAYLAGGRAREIPAVMEAMKMSAEGSFEVAFNAACALVEVGSLEEAEKQLQLAQRVGEESLYDEDLGEDEVALELAPVAAQRAYVAARLGRGREAVSACQALLALPLDDDATAATASSNLCTVLLEEGPAERKVVGECLKRLDAFMERGGGMVKLKKSLESRLGPAQKKSLLFNYATVALLAGKADLARDAIRGLEKLAPSSVALLLLQASQLAADKKLGEASAALEIAASAGDSADLAVGLMRVQLAAMAGDVQKALQLLKVLPGVQSKPGILATHAALLQQSGDSLGAAALLSEALAQHPPGSTGAAWILRRLAALELRDGDLQAAMSHLHQLLSSDATAAANESELLPQYARLRALGDPSTMGPLPAQLQQVSPPLPLKEVDSLENANVALAAGGRRRGSDNAAAVPVPGALRKRGAGEQEVVKQKKRRKRRKRLPNGYDPANPPPPPDPERWLPKWERADAKKKHKKKYREKDAVKGSQGAGKVDESLDRTHGTEEVEMVDAGKPKLPSKPAGKGKKSGKGRR